MVAGGRRPPSRKLYIAGRTLRVFDHQSPRAIKSPSPWFFSARTTNHALALYTITIDRMYDEKKNTVPPDRVKLWHLSLVAEFVDGGRGRRNVYDKKSQRYANDKRTAFCTTNANYWHTLSIARPFCDSRATRFQSDIDSGSENNRGTTCSNVHQKRIQAMWTLTSVVNGIRLAVTA